MDQLDAIACTPDGQKIYLIDKYTAPGAGTGMLTYYDVGTAAYVEMGEVRLGGEAGPLVPQIVLAAFSPSGDKLYAVSQTTNSLYEIRSVQISSIPFMPLLKARHLRA